jgi:hypothetical protein
MAELIVSFEQLLDLVEGRLSGEHAVQLRAQIGDHGPTQRELARVEKLVALMRSDYSVDPPDYVLKRALRLFRPAEQPTPVAKLRHLVASMRFDSGFAPLVMGMRSGPAEGRQMLYDADDRVIDLRINPERNTWRLTGQILGPDEPGVVELRSDEFSAMAELNDMCEFVLSAIPSGRYSLFIRQGNQEVEIADLEIQRA